MSDNQSQSKEVKKTKTTKLRKFTTSINGKVYVTEAENAVEAGKIATKLAKENK